MINPILIAMNIVKDTQHYKQQRRFRRQFIKEVIGQGKQIYRGYTKNKDKPWLDEVHHVLDNGVIVVINPFKKQLVTTKIARPAQIKAVYRLPHFDGIKNGKVQTHQANKPAPEYVLKKAQYHEDQKWNDDKTLPPKALWKAVRGLRQRDLGEALKPYNPSETNNGTQSYEYIYDPEHRKHPGGGFQKTEKGWSKA